jgi:hypothetical protein
MAGGAMALAAIVALGACSSSSDGPVTPSDDTPAESGASTVPTPSTAKPPPRTPGVDPFPLPGGNAGVTGAEVCDRSRDAMTAALGSAGTSTPDPDLSRCTFLRGGVTYAITVFPFDAYELAKANAFQVSDGDIEVTINRRKAAWYAGPGVAASRMMVQMSDLSSLLVERNGDGGAETQRAEMTKIAEAVLPVFEAIEPPPLTTPTTSVASATPVPPSTAAGAAPVATTAVA